MALIPSFEFFSHVSHPLDSSKIAQNGEQQKGQLHQQMANYWDGTKKGSDHQKSNPFRPLHPTHFAFNSQPFGPRSGVAHHERTSNGEDNKEDGQGALRIGRTTPLKMPRKPQKHKHLAKPVKGAIKKGPERGLLFVLLGNLTIQDVTGSGQDYHPGPPKKGSSAVNQPCHRTQNQTCQGQDVRMHM
jgi:hypothetical protein